MNFGIIAAGEGSRLAEEGIEVPKPLVEINGEPMIGRLLRIFGDIGAEHVAVVCNGDHPETARYLETIREKFPFKLTVKEAVTPSSMHTFHLLGNMLRGKGRFITTTVDTIFNPENFAGYTKAYSGQPGNMAGMMAVTDYIDDEKPLYVATDEDMNITAFLDKPEKDIKYISAGIYGLDDRALKVLDNCMERGIHRMRNYQRALLESGLPLKAYNIGRAIDVDHIHDLELAQQIAG